MGRSAVRCESPALRLGMKTAKVQHPPTEEEAMAAKKKIAEKKIYGNKTKFVLGLPRDMSAKQVVSEGKKQGIVLSEAHVYKIRSTAKSKGATPAPKRGRGAKAAAPAKGGAAKGGAGVSKRDFVLSFGPEVKASEILKRAKDAGVGLSKAYLYTIRSAGTPAPRRGAGRAAAPTRALSKSQANAFARVKSGVTALEAQFIDAAIDMGLSKAGDLLERLRSRLKGGL
jgi:hypothetical protein